MVAAVTALSLTSDMTSLDAPLILAAVVAVLAGFAGWATYRATRDARHEHDTRSDYVALLDGLDDWLYDGEGAAR